MYLMDMDMILDKVVPGVLVWTHTDQTKGLSESKIIRLLLHVLVMIAQYSDSQVLKYPLDTNANSTDEHPRVSYTKAPLVGISFKYQLRITIGGCV